AFRSRESFRRRLYVSPYLLNFCEFDIRGRAADKHTQALQPAYSGCLSYACASHSCHPTLGARPCRRQLSRNKKIQNPFADRFRQSSNCSSCPDSPPEFDQVSLATE